MPFDEPIWRDGDPSKAVTAQALTQLGKQYATAIADVTAGIADPDDPIGAAVAAVAGERIAAIPDGSLPQSKIANLGTTLAGKSDVPATVNATVTTATYTITGPGYVTLTLTRSISLVLPAVTPGTAIILKVKQDATGTRTITWPSTVEWPNLGAPPILNQNPNTANRIALSALPGDTKWQGDLVS